MDGWMDGCCTHWGKPESAYSEKAQWVMISYRCVELKQLTKGKSNYNNVADTLIDVSR